MRAFNEFLQAERFQRSLKISPETQGAESAESGQISASASFHARISRSPLCLGKNWVLPLLPAFN